MLSISMRTKAVETEIAKLRQKLGGTDSEDRPATISGTVHWLWPEIKVCVENGYKRTQLLNVLNKFGVNPNYDTLTRLIRDLQNRDVLNARRELRKKARGAS